MPVNSAPAAVRAKLSRMAPARMAAISNIVPIRGARSPARATCPGSSARTTPKSTTSDQSDQRGVDPVVQVYGEPAEAAPEAAELADFFPPKLVQPGGIEHVVEQAGGLESQPLPQPGGRHPRGGLERAVRQPVLSGLGIGPTRWAGEPEVRGVELGLPACSCLQQHSHRGGGRGYGHGQ